MVSTRLAEVTLESILYPNKHIATGFTQHSTTDQTGEYRFLLVPPGEYDVEIAKDGFQAEVIRAVRVAVGQVAVVRSEIRLGAGRDTAVVEATPELLETTRSEQTSHLSESLLAQLPIDRRDYLTFATLTPGVVDSNQIASFTDYRVKQAVQSGLSFFGSNGRGNSVTVDGGEANDGGGGVRSTLPQEAVQEFQVNRSNYSAELGNSSGGAIDIVSRSGTNQWHGSAFDYVRHQSLDATNPFARVLQNDALVRVKPSSRRQQFGGSLGGPLRRDRTFLFTAFEGLIRRESSVVPILTDTSIFGPTPAQQAVLNTLPAPTAAALRAALTASPSTRALFTSNSGVFPFATDSWRYSLRLDQTMGGRDTVFFRHNFSHIDESNANLQGLLGASRGTVSHQFDPTTVLGWTRIVSPSLVNQAYLQWAYRGFQMNSVDPYGPELRISGFGTFNHDYLLPSRNIERRTELKDDLTWTSGRHTVKLGGDLLIRGARAESEIFFSGRFTFGNLPGSVLNPALPSTFVLNALQTFNLGLAQKTVRDSWSLTAAGIG